MGADLLTVALPADETAMHTAIDNASIKQLAQFLSGEDELNAIWDTFVGSPILELDGPVPVTTIEAELYREPRIANEIRTIMHSAVERLHSRYSISMRVAGVDFVVAGGLSWGDEPYDGWGEHCSLAALLEVLGAGVPTEAVITP